MKRTFKLIATQSEIAWIGRKVTGSHNGTISIREGSLDFTNDQLTGGIVIIDTTSIKILDVKDASINAQFTAHLASDDFFSSARYPFAVLEIVSTAKRSDSRFFIAAKLTIKGITHPVNFEADVFFAGDSVKASGKIIINRTLYGMKFRSGNFFQNLGDTMIYNDIDINVMITAKASATAAMA